MFRQSSRWMTHAVPSLFPAKKFAGLPRTRFSRIRASLLLSAVRRSSVFEARSARQRSAARVMPTPSSPSSRDRETREAPDTALLTEPETYGSFAASLPGLTGADASLISPDSRTYGRSGLSASPFLNTPERAAYARGRNMAAAVAAEAGETHPDPRARVEAFAANLARRAAAARMMCTPRRAARIPRRDSTWSAGAGGSRRRRRDAGRIARRRTDRFARRDVSDVSLQ